MKIFILGSSNINKLDYANSLIAINDDLNVCKAFSSNCPFEGKLSEYLYYMDIDDINLSFKNNALLYIDYSDEEISGITLDDFYASEIVNMSIDHFNMISDNNLPLDDMLIVWIDSKTSGVNVKKELANVKFLEERIENKNIPVLYFLNETTNEVAKLVNEYISGDKESRQKIIEENL